MKKTLLLQEDFGPCAQNFLLLEYSTVENIGFTFTWESLDLQNMFLLNLYELLVHFFKIFKSRDRVV